MVERGTLPEQRVVDGHARDDRVVAPSARIRAPAIAVFGAVAALRERLAWFEARPLAGSTRRGHARAGAGERAGGAAARARRGRGRGAGDPDRRRSTGSRPELRRLRPRLPDEPERRAAAVRAARRGRARRPRAGRARTVAAIGPGTAAALRAHGVIADVVPGAVRRRGAGRGAGRRARQARAGRAGGGGPRRAARRAARARRRGRRAWRCTRPSPSRCRDGAARRGRATPTT